MTSNESTNNMRKLDQRGNNYFITNKKKFEPINISLENKINTVFDFAYEMTFGDSGEHRRNRSGGQIRRKNGELFINTFQGKLAEFGVYEYFKNKGIKTDEPDLSKWELGKWDSSDLTINDNKINIKSTKHFGNLMLLEVKDWNSDGQYIPNIETGDSWYDYFLLTRMKPDGESIMKQNFLLYSNTVPNGKSSLKEIILNHNWEFDIPGYISLEDFKYTIDNDYILPQNSYLNGRIPMDAENYYIQSGDMKNIDEILKLIHS